MALVERGVPLRVGLSLYDLLALFAPSSAMFLSLRCVSVIGRKKYCDYIIISENKRKNGNVIIL